MKFMRKGAAVALSALCASAYGSNGDRRKGPFPFQIWSPDHIRTLHDKARGGDVVDLLPHQGFSSYDFCDDRMGEGDDRMGEGMSPALRFRHRNQRDVFEVRGGTRTGRHWGYIRSLGEHVDCGDAWLSLGDRSVRVADVDQDFFFRWRAMNPGSELHTDNGQAVRRAAVRSNHCYLIGHSHFYPAWGHYALSVFRVKRHRENRSVVIDQAKRVFSIRYSNDD